MTAASQAEQGRMSPLARSTRGSEDRLNPQGSSIAAGPFRRLSVEQNQRLAVKIHRRSSTESNTVVAADRVPSDAGITRTQSSALTAREERLFSEIELHEIKTNMGIIERLWRELTMGADVIQPSVMSSVHYYLGEIGSDLFRRLFLNNARIKTVIWSVRFRINLVTSAYVLLFGR